MKDKRTKVFVYRILHNLNIWQASPGVRFERELSVRAGRWSFRYPERITRPMMRRIFEEVRQSEGWEPMHPAHLTRELSGILVDPCQLSMTVHGEAVPAYRLRHPWRARAAFVRDTGASYIDWHYRSAIPGAEEKWAVWEEESLY